MAAPHQSAAVCSKSPTCSQFAYPNETRSRYSRVYVLIFCWESEDPRLPVSHEIAELIKVLDEIYHFDIEVFRIPEKRSHARVSERVNAFVAINDDSKDDLKIVYYAGHGRSSKTRDLPGMD